MSLLENAVVTDVEENVGGLQGERNLEPMDSSNIVCSKLSFDVIQLVLSFLAIPDLWRCKVVCKDWRNLVRDPSFHELCHQNGKHHDYLFMWRILCSEFVVDPLFVRTLSFLDVGARRWYSILTAGPREFETRFMAMNDGLVCKLTSSPGEDENFALAISNPVSKMETILPSAPECFRSDQPHPKIVPIVDDVTGMHHKMFIIRNLLDAGTQEHPQQVYLHDTFTDEWSELVDPPYQVDSAVSLHGNLYITGCHYETWDGKLNEFVVISSYNHHEDKWTEVLRMNFDDRIALNPRLVVSGNRLFVIVHLHGFTIYPNRFPFEFINYRENLQEMYEILIPENVRMPVVQFTCRQLRSIFRDRTEDPHIIPCFDSDGLCNSLVLVSRHSGKLIKYALATGSHTDLPQHPLLSIPEEAGVPNISRTFDPESNRFMMLYIIKNMKLSLRNLPGQHAQVQPRA